MHQHEQQVAKRCHEFIKRFAPSAAAWGDLLGRWHDLGKYSNEFQAYLAATTDREISICSSDSDPHQAELQGRVDHSTAAAQFATEKFGPLGKLLAYSFAGHHAGLPDWDDGQSQSGLRQRLKKTICNWKNNAPAKLQAVRQPFFPNFAELGSTPIASGDHTRQTFRIAFWIRMTFSCLVDADFLATEAFMSRERSAQRPRSTVSMTRLADCLSDAIDALAMKAGASVVNSARVHVRQQCRERFGMPPGFFSLNVPTGGGKTLASLEFALRHAAAHDLGRVVFAVPFTSIIEQNAQVYRDIFQVIEGEHVLEHHSSLDPDKESITNRLQAENWDAPIVVTTNVQLFESLFATRTSKCRKLHRIARSVIVLDEAQALPIDLLHPTLLALKELVEFYGCSVVLCTATQPALDYRDDFPIGLQNIRAIIEKPTELYESLRRVRVNVAGKRSNAELADCLAGHRQALCIVNTRSEASDIYDRFASSGAAFHLSTRMCAAHRLGKLAEIHHRLRDDRSCRVVSTQLIEAGVDVDFPVVYRAICGIDSLAQAAGRCNREGRLDQGEVTLFESERQPPAGYLRQAAQTTNELIPDFDDLLSPSAIERYFQLQYWQNSDAWDRHDVLGKFGTNANSMRFNFREADQCYQFIREDTETLVVPWNTEAEVLVAQLDRSEFLDKSFWRKLQRHCIQIRKNELRHLLSVSAVEKKQERWVLMHSHLYDKEVGLRISHANGVLPVEGLIC